MLTASARLRAVPFSRQRCAAAACLLALAGAGTRAASARAAGRETYAPNEIVVQGQGTSVNGSTSPQVFSGVESIMANMMGGDDRLTADSRTLDWRSGTWQHVDLTDGTHLGVYGGPGDDELHGGAGADQLHAGTGFDTVWAAQSRDQVKDNCLLDRGAHGATLAGCANVNYRDTPYQSHAEYRPVAPPPTATTSPPLGH